jgi:hypothetical protein
MPHREELQIVRLLFVLLASSAVTVTAAPPFELGDGGQTFIYRAQPGESPSVVAKSFGVPDERIGSFLMANGIKDATRVPLGFEYRVPNPLAPQVSALSARVAELQGTVAARTARTTELERSVEQLTKQATIAADKEARLRTLERRWPIALTALVVALLGIAGALWTARLALRRLDLVERRASALAHELEDRRRTVLAERQEAGHRILELENRVRQLECQPRLVGGRG